MIGLEVLYNHYKSTIGSKKEAAEKLGVSPQQFNSWIKEIKPIPYSRIEAICNLYDVNADVAELIPLSLDNLEQLQLKAILLDIDMEKGGQVGEELENVIKKIAKLQVLKDINKLLDEENCIELFEDIIWNTRDLNMRNALRVVNVALSRQRNFGTFTILDSPIDKEYVEEFKKLIAKYVKSSNASDVEI